MLIPTRLLVHEVEVTPYLGHGSTGPLFGPPFTLKCMAQGARRLVRNSDGEQVLSDLTVYAALEDAPLVPEGSRVTWRGRTTTVLANTAHDDGGLGAPQHTELSCGGGAGGQP